jgi:hypothetical protein
MPWVKSWPSSHSSTTQRAYDERFRSSRRTATASVPARACPGGCAIVLDLAGGQSVSWGMGPRRGYSGVSWLLGPETASRA